MKRIFYNHCVIECAFMWFIGYGCIYADTCLADNLPIIVGRQMVLRLSEISTNGYDNTNDCLAIMRRSDIQLSEIYPGEFKPYYISDALSYSIVKTLATRDAQTSKGHAGPLFDHIYDKIDPDMAWNYLCGMVSFKYACEANSKIAWDIILSRKDAPESISDLFLLTQIMWGDDLCFVANASDIHRDFIPASSSLPAPVPVSRWCLPPGTPEQWRLLFNGSNCVYRLLAITGYEQWVDSHEGSEVIRAALLDQCWAIRHEALSHLQQLLPHAQLQLLEEYLQRDDAKTNLTGTEQEAAKCFNDAVNWKIHELKRSIPESTDSNIP